MRLSLIAAMGENRVIGCRGALPWRLPADLQYFRETTWGHPVIMGRLTWDSVGRPLKGRRNLVVSRRPDFHAEGAEVCSSFSEALERVRNEEEVFVVGGSQIYALALPVADRIHLTLIHAEFDGDTWFPRFEGREWELVSQDDRPTDDDHAYAFSFLIYERVVRAAAGGDAGPLQRPD